MSQCVAIAFLRSWANVALMIRNVDSEIKSFFASGRFRVIFSRKDRKERGGSFVIIEISGRFGANDAGDETSGANEVERSVLTF
jgi:hypothetical protein